VVWNGHWKRPHGTAAQYIVLPGVRAVRLPDRVDYAAGACLGIPALTAIQAVRLAQVGAGTRVLIAAGAGCVGHYAIQLAKHRGAWVVATISNDTKAAHARAAGADEAINCHTESVGERVKELTQGQGVDALIEMDLSGNAMGNVVLDIPWAVRDRGRNTNGPGRRRVTKVTLPRHRDSAQFQR
jgi:NADPH:quinone reductase